MPANPGTPESLDRRDSDIARLRDRVAVLEDQQDKTERLVQGMHYALFGLPEDRNNNGLIGEMHEIRASLASANTKLIALLLSALGAIALLVIELATRSIH